MASVTPLHARCFREANGAIYRKKRTATALTVRVAAVSVSCSVVLGHGRHTGAAGSVGSPGPWFVAGAR